MFGKLAAVTGTSFAEPVEDILALLRMSYKSHECVFVSEKLHKLGERAEKFAVNAYLAAGCFSEHGDCPEFMLREPVIGIIGITVPTFYVIMVIRIFQAAVCVGFS